MQLVIDTNIIVSALLSADSNAFADEFQRGIEKEFTKMVTNAKLYPGMIMECADFFSTLFLSLELGGDTS